MIAGIGMEPFLNKQDMVNLALQNLVFLQRIVIHINFLMGKFQRESLFAIHAITDFALTQGTCGLERQKKILKTW
jgi:hypothetical protein